jgi:hypothetical protein
MAKKHKHVDLFTPDPDRQFVSDENVVEADIRAQVVELVKCLGRFETEQRSMHLSLSIEAIDGLIRMANMFKRRLYVERRALNDSFRKEKEARAEAMGRQLRSLPEQSPPQRPY